MQKILDGWYVNVILCQSNGSQNPIFGLNSLGPNGAGLVLLLLSAALRSVVAPWVSQSSSSRTVKEIRSPTFKFAGTWSHYLFDCWLLIGSISLQMHLPQPLQFRHMFGWDFCIPAIDIWDILEKQRLRWRVDHQLQNYFLSNPDVYELITFKLQVTMWY